MIERTSWDGPSERASGRRTIWEAVGEEGTVGKRRHRFQRMLGEHPPAGPVQQGALVRFAARRPTGTADTIVIVRGTLSSPSSARTRAVSVSRPASARRRAPRTRVRPPRSVRPAPRPRTPRPRRMSGQHRSIGPAYTTIASTMITSRLRPDQVQEPSSSTWPRSRVRSRPSRSVSRVSSGCPPVAGHQVRAPRTRISPVPSRGHLPGLLVQDADLDPRMRPAHRVHGPGRMGRRA